MVPKLYVNQARFSNNYLFQYLFTEIEKATPMAIVINNIPNAHDKYLSEIINCLFLLIK